MMIQVKVPSIACEACVATIMKALQADQPEAHITVDLTTKMVIVETMASEQAVKQVIEAAGHTVEA